MDKLQQVTYGPETDNPFLFIDYIELGPVWEWLKRFFGESVDYGFFGSGIKFLITVLALFFLTLLAYCAVRLLEIRKKEHEHLRHEIAEYAHHHKAKEEAQAAAPSANPRWLKVLEYTFSETPSDWKLAIIEADSLLDDLLDTLGFRGESLGEKLRSADQERFPMLTRAWEVHTIRNNIAHEGSTFEISHVEAKRVVAVYEQIFRNYGFI
jgi:hypothetical protein